MQRRFIFIVNPISGTRGKSSLQELIKEKTTKAGFPFFIFPSVADSDYSFLHETITQEKITDVVIAGGDGTVNGVVNSLRSFSLRFGIIPCGSGNGLAFSAGLPKEPTAALDIIFKGTNEAIDAFTVNDRFACMLCGLGFDAQVAHDFAADPARGIKTYIKQSVKNFFIAKPYPFVLEMDNNTLELEAFFISIANSNQFGNNVTIAPKASLSDGLLDIVIVTKQNKLALLVQTAWQVYGFNKLKEVDVVDINAGVIYFQTDKIKIKNIGAAPMHLDGEPVDTEKKLKVEIIKDCFRLIVP
jgi:YegS/Rv2252/BmrU family lipid kinase